MRSNLNNYIIRSLICSKQNQDISNCCSEYEQGDEVPVAPTQSVVIYQQSLSADKELGTVSIIFYPVLEWLLKYHKKLKFNVYLHENTQKLRIYV